MTHLLLLIHILLYPPAGGKPVEVEKYAVQTYKEGYWPDATLYGDTYSPAGRNPCQDVAEEVIHTLQMGNNSYDALLPGSRETITYDLKCVYEI